MKKEGTEVDLRANQERYAEMVERRGATPDSALRSQLILRVPAELHKQLKVLAAQQGRRSMNSLATQLLARGLADFNDRIVADGEWCFVEHREQWVVVAWLNKEQGLEGEDLGECDTLEEALEEFRAAEATIAEQAREEER